MRRAFISAEIGHTMLACGLMIASGFAALAYQIVWTQQTTSWLGHESAAVFAVVAAFFGGLGFGALLLSSRIERSSHPTRWYALCEIAIGIWSLALVGLLKPVSSMLLELIGAQPAPLWHWFVAFLGSFLLLLPATMAMGATLPAMERVLNTLRPKNTTISVLYAANTLGAVLGVLAAAFWLVPQWGLLRTAIICALLNFACAIGTLVLPRCSNHAARAPERPRERGMFALLAMTGALGIGYEVLIVRALSQVAENTVYTFAILLAVYLIGTTVGAALYARFVPIPDSRFPIDDSRLPTPDSRRDRLLQMLALTCLLGALAVARAADIKLHVLRALGDGMAAALVAEAALATAAYLLPTIVMGALFSHLSTSARAAGISFARALGVNTLGAASAPILFGVLLVPWLGLDVALLLIALGYLCLAARAAWVKPTQWALVAVTLAAVVWHPAIHTVAIPKGGRLISHIEGVTASVSVVEDAQGIATLHINNRQQEGSSATVLADARQALLPILLHPAPRDALFLGVGTGITASAATAEPSLRVDAVELIPEVIAASEYFTRELRPFADSARLRFMSADARRFVRTTTEHYDVIVSDNFHPARSGSASLYTVEHFEFVKRRLEAGGLFCQWLPLHQLDLDTLRSIVRSFLTVYPEATAMLATNSLDTPVIGLLSRRDGERFDLEQVRLRLHDDTSSMRLADFGLSDDLSLLGGFIAGPRALAAFAGDAPLNTDDHPVIAYRAPQITYSPDSAPRDRLLSLLDALAIEPDELLATTSADREWRDRLVAYWMARGRFIAAGRNVRATSNVRDMLAQVREPLLSILEISPDFRPAYDPLLQMASALSTVDIEAAKLLLRQLHEVQPARPQAMAMLQELSMSPSSPRISLVPVEP